MTKNTVKVNVRIPQSTFDWIIGSGYTVTEAVNKALIRSFYKKAHFINLRLEDTQILNRLSELEEDYIKIATARNR